MADADVLVVGSGFGGAFAAARLTAAGVRVIVIERGPWRDTVPVRSLGIEERAPLPCGRWFASHMLRTLRSPWLPGGVTLNRKGLFELYVGKGLNVACTSSVGGGSHAYGGLNMRPAVDGYWNGHTDDICEKTMEPHYQSVFESMGSRAPRPGDQVPNTTAQRFGDSPVLQSGWDTVDVPMGFLFPRVAGSPQPLVTADGVTRHEADMRDGGFLGSTTGAKTTLDFVLLAAAMRKGLAVEALYEVTAIERLASGSPSRYRIEAIDHRVGRRRDFLADHVLLAAGTLNTLRLLLHSRDAGKLTGMPRLGYRFGGNGDFLGYWNLDDRTRDLTRGLPVHGLLRMKEPDPLQPRRHAASDLVEAQDDSRVAHRRDGAGHAGRCRPLQARSHADRIRYDPQRDLRRPHRCLRDDLRGDRQAHSAFSAAPHRPPDGRRVSGANRRERCGRFERRGLRPRRPLRRRRGRAARSRGRPAGDDGRRMGAACGRPLHRAIHALRITVFSTGQANPGCERT